MGATVLGTYGQLVLSSDGNYSYTLYTQAENPTAYAALQALDDLETLQDQFTYTATDGTATSNSSTLTVTVFGTNDVPVADLNGGGGGLNNVVTFTEASIVVFTTNVDGSLPSQINLNADGDTQAAFLTPVQGYSSYGFDGNFLRSPTGNIVTLQLNDLPAHTTLSLDFLFAAIDSLDGTGTFPQGDFFNVTVDGVSIFRESFENAQGTRTRAMCALGVQLARRVDLGFSGPGGFYTDSAYDLGADPVFQKHPSYRLLRHYYISDRRSRYSGYKR